MIRFALDFYDRHRSDGDEVVMVTVGKRGRDFLVRFGVPVIAEFTGLNDRPTILEVAPIVRLIMDDYLNGIFKSVYLAYSQFISTMTQNPMLMPMLPMAEMHLASMQGEDNPQLLDYIFEPSAAAILDALLPRYVEVQMYQALLESIASEQSARMVAMHNASDNGEDIIDQLTLTYNKARQAAITRGAHRYLNERCGCWLRNAGMPDSGDRIQDAGFRMQATPAMPDHPYHAARLIRDACIVGIAVALFLALSFRNITLPGLYYDEALDVVPAMQLLQGTPLSSRCAARR